MRTRFTAFAIVFAILASCSPEAIEIPEPVVADSHMVFHAVMDGGTRSSVVMNDSGTHADVVWNDGDQIVVFAVLPNRAQYYSDVFTTYSGGSSEADFSSDSWSPTGTPLSFMAYYPADRFYGLSPWGDTDFCFGIAVPPVQQAVLGGIEEGLNQSVAFNGDPATEAGSLHFKNVLSLVHFTLDGPGASMVSRVKLNVNYTAAGDGVYVASPDGDGYVTLDAYFALNYEHASSITLEGAFEAGGDYYFALAPGESEGFSITFFDDNGDYITKTSGATLNARRSRILELGTISVEDSFSAVPDGVEHYMVQTQGANPVDLVVIGDGFTAYEQDTFTDRAHEAIDALFSTPPFSTYRDWFNVYIMPVESNESGASKTDGNHNVTEYHDTYFRTAWGEKNYGDMSADMDKVFGFVESKCPDIVKEKISLDDVSILLLINDTRYGGICYQYPYGRAVALVPFVSGGNGMTWGYPSVTAVSESDVSSGIKNTPSDMYASLGSCTGNWLNVVLHEFGGHGFGRFADEYWGSGTSYDTSTTIGTHTWPVPTALNISATYDNVPWQTDVLDNLDVMSLMWDQRYGDRIGIFQGGGGYAVNRWRSERISCMIDNRPYFSTWQRVLIVKRLMELAGGTFDMETFLDYDDPTDPVRDGGSFFVPLDGKGLFPYDGPVDPVKFYPPLPPPVLVED